MHLHIQSAEHWDKEGHTLHPLKEFITLSKIFAILSGLTTDKLETTHFKIRSTGRSP
jgi:hypothetical protein